MLAQMPKGAIEALERSVTTPNAFVLKGCMALPTSVDLFQPSGEARLSVMGHIWLELLFNKPVQPVVCFPHLSVDFPGLLRGVVGEQDRRRRE